MIWYGVASAMVIIFLVLVPVILETIARKKNPTPRMNNADKRFIEIKNIKTREMFEVVKG